MEYELPDSDWKDKTQAAIWRSQMEKWHKISLDRIT